ncbi:MAG: CoA-transferase [Mycobacterium sp.]|nr:CoA-transferase [Mycobacterium sp.]
MWFMADSNESIPGPLHGIRVLELGNYIAAPTTGRLLADFGAEVIKVERPGTGDELRNWRLYAGTTSMLFRTVNRNKKSIVVDLKSDEGREVVLGIARSCDVVLENFRPGTLERWGLGPEDLDAVNDKVVVVRISAFGQTGPMAGQPGFAAVAEAAGGLRHLVGDPDRPPSRVGVSIGDSIAGLFGAFGVVMTLFAQGRSAVPVALEQRVIDVALNESVLSMMESLVPDYLAYGTERVRTGGRMEGIAPSNAYGCSDGASVVVAGNGDAIFRRYMAVIGREDLALRADLQTNAGRWAARDELDDAITDWTGARSRDEVLTALGEAGIPAGPINTAADICVDGQLLSRNMIQFFDVDAGAEQPKRVGFTGIVPVIGGRSRPIDAVGPDLGQHTAEVVAELARRPAVAR